MPRKSRIAIAVTLASLQSVTPWSGDTGHTENAGITPEVNRNATPEIVVAAPTEARTAQIPAGLEAAAANRAVASPKPNLFGSTPSSAQTEFSIGNGVVSLGQDRTSTVHTRASPSAPAACGPSSMSVEDIKALVVDRAGRYHVNPDFALAIAWTESRFDRVRNSPRGARGPMQLMPDTARLLNVVDVCDPVQNIDGGMRHLRALLDEFKNPIIAAAAYNAGKKAIYDSAGMPAYPETVRYVASVINHQFGLNFPEQPSVRRFDHTSDIDNAIDSVIGIRPPHFVGGVMQF